MEGTTLVKKTPSVPTIHHTVCHIAINHLDPDPRQHIGQRPRVKSIATSVSTFHFPRITQPIRDLLIPAAPAQSLFTIQSRPPNNLLQIPPTFATLNFTMSSNLDMLYEELDQALAELKARDQKLTSKMKEMHFWFVSRHHSPSPKIPTSSRYEYIYLIESCVINQQRAALETCEKIKSHHERGLQLSEERIDTFKAIKKEIRKVRDEMKDLFDVLFVDGWTSEPEK